MKGKENPMWGRKHSDKTRAIMRKRKVGPLNPMSGLNHAASTKKKIGEAQTGRRWVYDVEGDEARRVSASAVDRFVKMGWVLGRKL